MGSIADANLEAFKQATGVRELSGSHGRALSALSDKAYQLIQIIQLHKSGIRGGDGSWGPSDVFGYAASDVVDAINNVRHAEASMASVSPNCPTTIGGRQLSTTHFGACPKTGANDGYLNIGHRHWFFSRSGKTKWLGGGDVFSSWQTETSEIWNRNRELLADYEVVEPIMHDDASDEVDRAEGYGHAVYEELGPFRSTALPKPHRF